MATKVYLLRHGPYDDISGMPNEFTDPNFQHFAGCPHHGPNRGNLDYARTFKNKSAAKATNEFKHWGYEIVEAELTITLK